MDALPLAAADLSGGIDRIGLGGMMVVRFSLSVRNVGDLPTDRGMEVWCAHVRALSLGPVTRERYAASWSAQRWRYLARTRSPRRLRRRRLKAAVFEAEVYQM
jgi:hypothetical protein